MWQQLANEMGITNEKTLIAIQKADELSGGGISAMGLDAKPIVAIVGILTEEVIEEIKPAKEISEKPAKIEKKKAKKKSKK